MNPSGAEKTFFRADHCAFPLGKDYDVGFQTMLRSCGSRYISRVRCVNMSLTSALKSELKTAFQWFVDVFLSGTISFIFKKSISISPCCVSASIYLRTEDLLPFRKLCFDAAPSRETRGHVHGSRDAWDP